MDNIIEKIKEQISGIIRSSIEKAVKKKQLQLTFHELPEIKVEIPREKEHGDFSTNIAMVMAKQAKKPPAAIAGFIIENASLEGTYIGKIESAGPGFINFRLSDRWLYDSLRLIEDRKEKYGTTDKAKNQKVQVEFVSANPTGPMHMGNARGAALGDSLAAVLEAAGYEVVREFYINDAGNQIENFALSLEARYLQLLGYEAQIPEGGYEGDDIVLHMKEFIEINGDSYIHKGAEERRRILKDYALKKNLDKLKQDLEAFGVSFDTWFSEQSLYESGYVDDTIKYLKQSNYTYEDSDALWFKASQFGTQKDEVIVRNNGIPTYLAGDIAYHRNKFMVRGFDRVIDIWGADHHGHIARLKASMEALACDPEKLEIIIMQLVRLFKNEETVRMSKRKGQAVTLADLIEEVGKDAARFFFIMRAADSHLDFDLGLAVEQSNENPVFYVQYAHARICSILRQIEDEGINTGSIEEPRLKLLSQPCEKELIRKLAELPEEILWAAEHREPWRITRYILDTASLFHSFYNSCRVMIEDRQLMLARYTLIKCTRIVIQNVLGLLKITAPERM